MYLLAERERELGVKVKELMLMTSEYRGAILERMPRRMRFLQMEVRLVAGLMDDGSKRSILRNVDRDY
jgi:hypothetical protein